LRNPALHHSTRRYLAPHLNMEGVSFLPVRATPRSTTDGYMVSSLDLRAGLSVREVLATSLPDEVVRELARLRRTWASPATSTPYKAR
jgi:hypothetical protein